MPNPTTLNLRKSVASDRVVDVRPVALPVVGGPRRSVAVDERVSPVLTNLIADDRPPCHARAHRHCCGQAQVHA